LRALTCCVVGHRELDFNSINQENLYKTFENLIALHNVKTFLFGSKSKFDNMCLDVVTKLKAKYPLIKRVYVRAEFQFIDKSYENYLLQFYDETFYPDCIIGAGKECYVERNYFMIDNSDYCIFYFNNNHMIKERKSGTKIAFDYAKRKNKTIINIFR
jgi:hypothetical protein